MKTMTALAAFGDVVIHGGSSVDRTHQVYPLCTNAAGGSSDRLMVHAQVSNVSAATLRYDIVHQRKPGPNTFRHAAAVNIECPGYTSRASPTIYTIPFCLSGVKCDMTDWELEQKMVRLGRQHSPRYSFRLTAVSKTFQPRGRAPPSYRPYSVQKLQSRVSRGKSASLRHSVKTSVSEHVSHMRTLQNIMGSSSCFST